MKHVIALVGTSLITNYLAEKGDHLIRTQCERYKHKPSSEYELNREDIIRIKKKLTQFASRTIQASAEIKSLIKLSEEFSDDHLVVHLMASDTINSRICAEVIRDAIHESMEVHFSDRDVIAGLQVKDRRLFAEQGMENLFKRIEDVSGGYYGNVIMNITGGYKAAIPLLTIFAQINLIPAYYIFEDTDTLMKIPLLPLSVDWEIFETYADVFGQVENSGGGVENWESITDQIRPGHRDAMLACFEVDGNYADISTVGRLLWSKYKFRRRVFYANDSVVDAFRKDRDYKDYLAKLFDETLRQGKTEDKNGHLVLDLGRTAPRIFYRIKDGTFYVYKYTRHDEDYERFIRAKPFDGLDGYGPFKLQSMKND